jgi:hypothetical protein
MPRTRSIGLGFVALGAAIAALIPVFMVLYPAAGIGQADAGRPEVVLPALAANPALFFGPGVLELLGHTIGAAAMVGLWLRLGQSSFALTCATVGGLLWMGVDVIDNAIALQLVPRLAADYVAAGAGSAGTAAAATSFIDLSRFVDALRLAGHFGGGLWVVGVSLVASRAAIVHPVVAWIGVAVGAVLAANLFVPALLNISFITLPVWLIGFGVALARPALAAMPTAARQPAVG